MYKSLVRPHLEYCDIIFHLPEIVNPPPLGITLPTLMMKLESVQYQAALAVNGAWKGSSRVKLYEDIGWESLSDRRWCKRILHVHKIVRGKTPKYLYEKLPPNRRNVINLPYVFQEIRCRTDRYLKSFYPNAVTNWNSIITNFEELPSFYSLKEYLNSLIRPDIKSTYGIHDPMQLRYITQLRVGLSKLRSHKKKHNFADTPLDQCLCKQGVEDSYHFLEICPFYVTHRETLKSSVNLILRRKSLPLPENYVKLYLYGHPDLDDKENQSVLTLT